MHRQLTEQLKNRAFDLGFNAVGIAPAVPLESARKAIEDRVASGLLKDYGFSARPAEAMTTPDQALPGAKSIIAVAMSYLTEDTRGSIARFARGQDYHKVLTERLQELADWLMTQTSGTRRVCVDTGPIIDRAVAQTAGIGSYGKNGSIIVPGFGSWVVLGEILTDVELTPDEPAPLDVCGNCDACIKACPVGAITSPYAIDQTKCLSHITQMKGSIPEDVRVRLGDRIYGCDTCQEACPRNCSASKGSFPIEGGLGANPAPEMLLAMSQADFKQLILPTAAGWIGRSRIRRNAAVALGNTGDPASTSILKKLEHDPDPLVREHVLWAIKNLQGRDSS